MRGRIAFIIVATLIAGLLAFQNWPEFTRSTPMTFGVIQTNMPLGLVLLTLLALTLAFFLVSAATQESRHLMEHRRQQRVLQAQRDLAEKAEVSRYTELRQQLDGHLRESRERDGMLASEFEKRVMQGQRELRAQLEQMNHMLAARLTEMEGRLGARPVAAAERVEAGTRQEPVRAKL